MKPRSSICVARLRHSYTTNPVGTGAYVAVKDGAAVVQFSLPEDSNELEIFDSSGQTLTLAYGPTGSEVEALQILPGGNGRVSQILNKGMVLSLKSKTATTPSGSELTINFYR